MPRQPWGIEASAFNSLWSLSRLRELVLQSGRLIGSQEALVSGLIGMKTLRVVEASESGLFDDIY